MKYFTITQDEEGYNTRSDRRTKCQICHELCEEKPENQIRSLYNNDEDIKMYLDQLWHNHWVNLKGNWYTTCKALRIATNLNCCESCMKRVITEFAENQ